jgi:hypothetical protein
MYTTEELNNRKIYPIDRSRENEIIARIKQYLFQAHDMIQLLSIEDRKQLEYFIKDLK